MSTVEDRNRFLKKKLKSIKEELSFAQGTLTICRAKLEKQFQEKYFSESPVSSPEKEQPTEISAEKREIPEFTEQRVDEEEQSVESSDKIHKDPSLRKMFKSIAKETHPDTLSQLSEFEKKQKKKLFDAARAAYENNDFEELAEISEQLGIETPELPDEYYEKVEKEITSLGNDLNVVYSSIVWQWFICTNKEEKENIRDEVFKRMENYIRA